MSYFNYDGVTRAQAKGMGATPVASVAKKAKATKVKSAKKSGKGRKTGGRRKGKQTFSTYIYKVLQGMNGNGMSKKGMAVMNSVVTDVFERLMKEASDAAKYAKKATVGQQEVVTAVKFILPGKLAQFAISNGNKAVTKFEQVSKDGAKSSKKKSVSRSSKAGLVFPVGRVARHMRKARVASRIGAAAPVFVAAVLEYITGEVLEKGSDLLGKSKRITPRVVNLGIMGDSELKQVFSKVTIAAGGVQPDNIHVSLLGKKAQKAAADDGGYYY